MFTGFLYFMKLSKNKKTAHTAEKGTVWLYTENTGLRPRRGKKQGAVWEEIQSERKWSREAGPLCF